MRILIYSQYYYPEVGAAQLRLMAMARQLKQLGHDVEILTSLPNHPTGRIFPGYQKKFYICEEIDGIKVHRFWLYTATGAGIKRLLNYLSFTITSFCGLFTCRKPDIILVNLSPLFLSLPGYFFSKVWRSSLVLHVADLWTDSVWALGLVKSKFVFNVLRVLENWSYKKAKIINAVTEGIYNSLLHERDIPENKVIFLPNGVDTSLFCPREADHKLAEDLCLADKKVILYAGTHGFAHGIEVAIEAAALLAHRTDIVFLFVGDGSEKKKLVELAKAKKLANIIFMDPRPPEYIARLYSISCIGLSTLRGSLLFEGTRPVKIFATMASGLPVLYCGAGEGAKLVDSIGAGVVTPPEDPRALADCVERLADDDATRNRLGQNGRKYVENELGWEKLMRDWVQKIKLMEPETKPDRK